MPELQPFRALRYDARVVLDASSVLCPPYDVISPDERARLAALDARNAVRLELPVDDAAEGGSAYDAAARTWATWVADGVLAADESPQVYVYEQQYTLGGSARAARGFFCRLRLEPFGDRSGVRPHEHTMSGPKEDRFRLMRAVPANLSPVLLMYDDGDGGRLADKLLRTLTEAMPAVDAAGPGGSRNRLWLADPASSAAARDLLGTAAAVPLTIADGHHRYETALRYRDQPDAPANAEWVLALLYEAHSGGLSLLPWHRLLHGCDGAALLEAATAWFLARRAASSSEIVAALQQSVDPGVVGLWTRAGGAVLAVDRDRVAPHLPPGGSDTLRWLDVNVVSSTLTTMIGTPVAELAADRRLTYVAGAGAAVAEVDSGRADAAVLLRPTPIEAVLDVAAASQFMPAKSTFFHPKAATGLVFNPLD